MKVWIAEAGDYEQRGVVGLYDSPERAMADIGGKNWRRTIWSGEGLRSSRWESWDNNKGASITPSDVVSEGRTRAADETVVQEVDALDPRGNRWAYTPISGEEADALVGTRRRYRRRKRPSE